MDLVRYSGMRDSHLVTFYNYLIKLGIEMSSNMDTVGFCCQ